MILGITFRQVAGIFVIGAAVGFSVAVILIKRPFKKDKDDKNA